MDSGKSIILILIAINLAFAVPRMRMRLCVASNNPYRLQNQCVYCHNKKFQNTVRVCTGTPYLPANVSLEEGYCMVRQCRSQMPLYRPEPFYYSPNDLGDVNVGVNVDALGPGPIPGSNMPPPAVSYEDNGPSPAYLHQNSRPMGFMSQPLRRRPPAQIFVGRPIKPQRPSLFGR